MTVNQVEKHFGSLREAARQMTESGYEISHQAMSKWRKRKIPRERQVQLAEVSGGRLRAGR